MNAALWTQVLLGGGAASAALLGGSLFLGMRPRERALELFAAGFTAFSACGLLVLALTNDSAATGDLLPALESGGFAVSLRYRVDAPALAYSALTVFLLGIVARFSARYLHRDPAYPKFFLWMSVLAVGLLSFSFADGFDLAFIGWELAGLSSVMLITFFRDQSRAALAGYSAWKVYRFSDAALLLATGLAHFGHEGAVVPAWFVGLLVVIAAQGKSAQFPFSDWLPSAMEGPTPSSAVFYGGLAIHLGPLLLLKMHEAWFPFLWLRALVGSLGLLSCLYGWRVGRLRGDAKSSLGYAALSQVGVMQMELAMGWGGLALWHLVGHAILRTWQILHVPGWITDVRRHRDYGRVLSAIERAPAASLRAPWHGYYVQAAFRSVVATPLSRGFAWLVDWDARRALISALSLGGLCASASALYLGGGAPLSLAIGAIVALEAYPWGRFYFLQPGWLALLWCEGAGYLDPSLKGALTLALLAIAGLRAGLALGARDHESSVRQSLLSVRAIIPATWMAGPAAHAAVGIEELVWFASVVVFSVVLRALRRLAPRMDLRRFHGLAASSPRLSRIYFATGLCLTGFPVSVGFLGEDLELHAFLSLGLAPALLYALTVSLLATAFLRNYLRLFHGPAAHKVAPELSWLSFISLASLIAGMAAGLIKGVIK